MKKNLTVYFDGDCPMCSREVSLYKKQKGAADISWIDATKVPLDSLPSNVTREALLEKLHVSDKEGNFYIGGNAFLKLWENLTYFRVLSKILSLTPFSWLTNKAYDRFLVFRPRLQKFFRKFEN